MNAKPFPVLETARLRLRAFRDTDVACLFTLSRDADVMQYYGMEPFATPAEALKEIVWFRNLFKTEVGVRWCITAKPEDVYIGDIGFFNYARAHARAELGYKLAKAYWRQGLISEIFPLVLAYGFTEMGLNRIEAPVDPRNTPSWRLLEKFHFTREGILREHEYEHGGFVDLAMYALLRREWDSGYAMSA